MKTYGLTGGIASGKSLASAEFKRLGALVIDADQVAHNLTAPGQPLLNQLKSSFGPGIFTPAGALDRHALRTRIWSDDSARKTLESILHPEIRSTMFAQRDAQPNHPYCIMVVPLLVENALQSFYDAIIVIHCPLDQQISRLKERDSLSDQMIHAILDRQADGETRLTHADYVLDNSTTANALLSQIHALHNLL